MDFKLLMFYNNIVKNSEMLIRVTSWKFALFTYPTNICIFWSYFYYRKNENIRFFFNKWKESNFMCIHSYDKRFNVKA